MRDGAIRPLIDTEYVPLGVLVWPLKFTTMLPPGAFTDDGAKFALTPVGRLLALTETLPVRPPTKVTVMVSVGFCPGNRVTGVEGTEMVKFGAATTVRLSAAVLVVVPLTPVTVSG